MQAGNNNAPSFRTKMLRRYKNKKIFHKEVYYI